MALEARLVQKLGQSLLMTPQLQQAIKLLQLGRLEYKEALERELLENPILEELPQSEEPQPVATSAGAEESSPTLQNASAPDNEPTSEPQKESAEWEEYVENLFSESRVLPSGSGSGGDYEDRPSLEATLTRGETLQEHLFAQLRLLDLPERDEAIALYVIGNIDKDGYLAATYEEIAESAGCELVDVERAIAALRTLDPKGIAARDLKECLLIQLDDLGLAESLAATIVAKHLEKVESRKLEHIVKAEQVGIDQIQAALLIIRELEPKPGRPFADDTIRYAIPDIYVYKVGNEYVISLNEDGLPKLRISPYYLELLRRDASDSEQNKSYLNERLKAATFLIKSIHQRQQTIVRVTQSIVKFQREFLDLGIARLKPLTLKDVADDIGMHESTVSRVTTNKFVHTPQGVFELKYFFTTGIKTLDGDVSSSTIKEKIKKIIDAESPDKPVSDQEIVEILKAENVIIARRTVAKYREGLNILSSSRRKRIF
ncbi:MAG: RNA polymerase sigma-54 factor [Proteobacteria bacterium]|nr:RNA polymerase sigma-54 factor [Pseudomonadota bacterium]